MTATPQPSFSSRSLRASLEGNDSLNPSLPVQHIQSGSGVGPGNKTYEAIHAGLESSTLPDPVEWDAALSFRNLPYRHLHHQQGVVGHIHLRLLQAEGLGERSGWSVLGMGPVKHLGLSKAHGEVSSFGSFWIQYVDPKRQRQRKHQQGAQNEILVAEEEERQPQEVFRSGVVPHNNRPVWNEHHHTCSFNIPVRKGAAPRDGMAMQLMVRMEEDRTATESLLPLGGGAAVLGEGSVDLTPFLLQEEARIRLRSEAATTTTTTSTTYNSNHSETPFYAAPLPPGTSVAGGIMESWVELRRPRIRPNAASAVASAASVGSVAKALTAKPEETTASSAVDALEEGRSYGRVRLRLSYAPHGMRPKPHDVCALESFARCDLERSTCPPLLPPHGPLVVVDDQSYPLLRMRYALSDEWSFTSHGNNNKRRYATIQVHRNAVFVVERRTLADNALHTLLMPVDGIRQHPLGDAVVSAAVPYVESVGEFAAPVVASGKLMLGVLKTTGGAGLAGLLSAGKVVVETAAQKIETKKYEVNRHRQNSN